MMKFLVALSLLLVNTLALAELKFYPLHYKTPVDIIANIEPFLDDGETVMTGHNELIVRAESHRLVDIERLIRSLDKPSRRLMIYVNRDGHINRDSSGFNVDGSIKYVDNNKGGNTRYRGSITASNDSLNSTDRYDQKIQALEGQPAFISQGVSHLIPGGHSHYYGVQGNYSRQAEYRDTTKGISLTPQLPQKSTVMPLSD